MFQYYKIKKIDTLKTTRTEFVVIDFEQQFYISNKDKNITVERYMGKSYPIYFNIDDDIHDEEIPSFRKENEQPSIKTIVFVNDNNIISEILNSHNFNMEYRLHIDLEKHQDINKKLLSENYKKEIYYIIETQCIMINLIYTPNMRTVKINKLLKNIKQNIIDYDI